MNKQMKDLVNKLEENNQSWEFYPTTKEIVQAVYDDLATKDRIIKRYSMLDVGCGNGGFFTKFQTIRNEVKEYHKLNNIDEDSWDFKENKKPIAQLGDEFAIEKSEILIQNLPSHIVVVGTDFWENTLIDKVVDIVFSNPPYSEFEEWSEKIIREAHSLIYLVIPDRWKESEKIKGALRMRGFEAEILGSFDFLDAERAARAKVNLLKISKKDGEKEMSDPFDVWFEQEFKVDLSEENDSWSVREKRGKEEEEKRQEEIKNEMVTGKDLIQVLVNLYERDMANLLNNYKKVSELDGKLLKELGIQLKNIKTGLKGKIKGLKNKYWEELFNNFDKITSRLCSKQRGNILNSLRSKTAIDFTVSNAYAIVIWVIKNANQYFGEQLKEMYLELTETEFVKKYKSNQKTWDQDRWRYKKDKTNTHYSLEYRVITHQEYNRTFISDVETIAKNLGFNYIGDVKTFKNNNIHFRFEKDFIKAFNIEAARLFGWIKSPQEAAQEFDGDCKVTVEEAAKYFENNLIITSNPQQLLLN